jgi:hypothetical protein
VAGTSFNSMRMSLLDDLTMMTGLRWWGNR